MHAASDSVREMSRVTETESQPELDGGESRAPAAAPGSVDGSMLGGLRQRIGGGALQHKLHQRALQRAAKEGAASPGDHHALAERGTSGAGGALPHQEAIQRSFGAHDVSGIVAHTDTHASAASRAMGAEAFAAGHHVAFDGAPSLHTAAHEAAHVVQQRGSVQLRGGVGEVGDTYEQHADAVADRVVRGAPADDLLAPYPARAASAEPHVQRRVVTTASALGISLGHGITHDEQAIADKLAAYEVVLGRDEDTTALVTELFGLCETFVKTQEAKLEDQRVPAPRLSAIKNLEADVNKERFLLATKAGLGGMRSHLTETDFGARAAKTGTGKIKLKNNKELASSSTVFLEPIPGAGKPITKVEAYKPGTDEILGDVKLNPTAEGRYDVPRDPAAKVKVHPKDDSAFDWTTGGDAPAKYRLAIEATGTMPKQGFAGGHTEDAWKTTVAAYGDLKDKDDHGGIEVKDTTRIKFKLKGTGTLLQLSKITYDYRGKKVAQPKTIFEGAGSGPVESFEAYMMGAAAEALSTADKKSRSVVVPLTVVGKNDEDVGIKVNILRDLPTPTDITGKLNTWYVDEAAFTNVKLQ